MNEKVDITRLKLLYNLSGSDCVQLQKLRGDDLETLTIKALIEFHSEGSIYERLRKATSYIIESYNRGVVVGKAVVRQDIRKKN